MKGPVVLNRDSPVWERVFYAVLAGYGLVILATFRAYGITTDEVTQDWYGRAIARWYTGFFQGPVVFQLKNLWLYGGAFDLPAYAVGTFVGEYILPLGRYDARHLCNALVGLMGVVAAYRIGCALEGRFAGFLSGLALALTPRYYGHAFNNPKDIPLAVFYLWSVYFLIRGLRTLPDLPRGLVWKTGLAIGLAMGVRVGGGILLGYLFVFWGARYVQLVQEGRAASWHLLRRFLFRAGVVLAVAYGTMLVFWPWAQVHPVWGPWQALRVFSAYVEPRVGFFGGGYVLNTELPWTYVPVWLGITLPEFVLLGVISGALLFGRAGDRASALQEGVLLASALLPLGYAAWTRLAVYDGIRHLLFCVPPLVVFGAVGVSKAAVRSGWGWRGLAAVCAVCAGMGLYEMIRLHPNQVVYFNSFVGGLAGAADRYETDYWEHSYKQGIRWIDANYGRFAGQKKLRLGSFYTNLQYEIDPERFEVATRPEDADLYLGTTRYDRHLLVPGEIVHTVRAGAVPLLYIIRPDSRFQDDPFFVDSPFRRLRAGELHEEAGRFSDALDVYRAVLARCEGESGCGVPVSRLRLRMGNVRQKLGDYEAALAEYRKALELEPGYEGVYSNIGVVRAQQGAYAEARDWFAQAVELHPGYVMGLVNLGSAHQALGDWEQALDAYDRAVRLDPGRADIHYNLGMVYVNLGRYEAAVSAFGRALEIAPGYAPAREYLEFAREHLR